MDSTHTSGFKHRAEVGGLLCSSNSSQYWEDLAIHSGQSHLFLYFSPTLNKFVFMIVHLFIQCGVMGIKTQTCRAAETAAGQKHIVFRMEHHLLLWVSIYLTQ